VRAERGGPTARGPCDGAAATVRNPSTALLLRVCAAFDAAQTQAALERPGAVLRELASGGSARPERAVGRARGPRA
jgi:hypothetical protein